MKRTLIIYMLITIYLIGVCIKKEIEIDRLNKKYSDLQDKIIQISKPKTTN